LIRIWWNAFVLCRIRKVALGVKALIVVERAVRARVFLGVTRQRAIMAHVDGRDEQTNVY
jgi:hypothetical protein